MVRSRIRDAVAGLIAAAVALGTGELVAAFTGGTSPAVAVGDVFVDYIPGPIVKAAIDALGTRDKPALLAGVSLGALAVGAALGPATGRRRWIGSAAFAGFGLIAPLAVARDPLTDTLIAIVIAAAAAAAAGWVALRLLLDAAGEQPAGAEPAAQMPGRGTAGRRRFLAFAAGGAGAAAFTAFAGRRLIGPTVDVEAQRAQITLPDVADAGTPAAVAPAATPAATPAADAAATATPTPAATPAAAAAAPTPVATPAAGAASAAPAIAADAQGGFAIPGLARLVTPNEDFYRIDTALVVPRVDASSWRLKVTGMVDRPFELGDDELLALTSTERSVTLACVSNEVGGDLVGNAYWLGVPLPQILERAGVQSGATQIVGRSVDGFTVGFPTEVALDGRTSMIALGMNGEPLPTSHGFPARLIVPGLHGYVSATKWLAEIELTTMESFDAYWIPRGWANQAPIKTQSRIDVPLAGRSVKAGRVAVAGVAWGGIRSISRVEVNSRLKDVNGPGQWREATVGPALTNASRRQWVFEWDATPGEYLIEVRATDGEAVTQTEKRQFPAPNGATGYHSITAKMVAA